MYRLTAIFVALTIFLSNANAYDQVATTATFYYPSLNTIDGNLHGKITLVEFFDYRCSYCREMADVLTELIKSNPNLRVVYRDYPVLGQFSLAAAQAALAAQQFGKYLTMQSAFWQFNQPLNTENILRLATTLQINDQQFKHAMSSSAIKQQLQENLAFGNSLGVTGIPTIIIAATPSLIDQQPIPAYLLVAPTLAELQKVIAKVAN